MNEKHKPGSDYIKVSVPAETKAYFDKQAHREGVSVQSLVAPVLNAVARGEISRPFQFPDGSADLRRPV